jgi:hypothetical protein
MRSFLSVFVFAVLFASVAFSATPTEEITAVRQRSLSGDGSVSASDKAVIEKYLRSAIDAMFLSPDSEQIARTRRQIVAQKGDKDLSMYASTYISTARELLRVAFGALEGVPDLQKRQMVKQHLVILTAELRSLMLAEFGLSYLNDPDLITRYWAVKAVADTVSTSGDAGRDNSVVGQMNDEVANDPEMATKIYEALSPMAEQDNPPQIDYLLIGYAGRWKDERAGRLLQQIVGKRTAAYQNWTVQNTWLDIPLFRALANWYQMAAAGEKALFARQFAELYAFAVQRWMLGRDSLAPVEKEQLLSLIVETDQEILPLFGLSAGRIKNIIERGQDLQAEFDNLFGTTTKQGELANKLRFNYGQGNSVSTAPPKLPPLPAEVTQAAGEDSGG